MILLTKRLIARMICLSRLSITFLVLIALLQLQACAFTPVNKHISEDQFEKMYQDAETAYGNKDYTKAASLLEQLAKRGYSKAQYTLGYLYFNGQGVNTDREIALRWTQLAASKGYPKAIQALQQYYQEIQRVKESTELLGKESVGSPGQKGLDKNENLLGNHSNDIENAKTSLNLSSQDSNAKKPLLIAVPSEPNGTVNDSLEMKSKNEKMQISSGQLEAGNQPLEINSNSSTTPASKPTFQNNEKWLLSQPQENYTLQLIAGDNEERIRLFIIEHDLQDHAVYFKSSKRKNPWYSVVYGSYSRVASAQKAIDDLPNELRNLTPWIRDFASVREYMVFYNASKK